MNRELCRVLMLYRLCDRIGLLRVVSKEKLFQGVGTVLNVTSPHAKMIKSVSSPPRA